MFHVISDKNNNAHPAPPKGDPKMKGRKTPDEKSEMVIAMLRAGKSYREIRSALDIGIGTIHNVARDMKDVDFKQIVKEIKSGYVARHLMLAEYLGSAIPTIFDTNANIKDVAIAMAIITDKAMKMEYTINEANRPKVPMAITQPTPNSYDRRVDRPLKKELVKQ